MMAFAASVLWSTSALAQFEEGKHYTVLDDPQVVNAPADKVMVEELFWFGCPYCYDLDKKIKPWVKTKGDDVIFEMVPAGFSRSWRSHAQLFYTIEVLGRMDDLGPKVFDAIHIGKNRLLGESAHIEFLTRIGGIEEEMAEKAYNSFFVKQMANKADKRVNNYRISGVPAFVVNGKYLVSAKKGGTAQEMMDVMQYLVDKEKSK